MSIRHNTYFNGKVQSLGFNHAGADFTVGVVMPGEYNFGKAERRETICVVMGALSINGQWYMPDGATDCVIQPGEQIYIMTKGVTMYICQYM